MKVHQKTTCRRWETNQAELKSSALRMRFSVIELPRRQSWRTTFLGICARVLETQPRKCKSRKGRISCHRGGAVLSFTFISFLPTVSALQLKMNS